MTSFKDFSFGKKERIEKQRAASRRWASANKERILASRRKQAGLPEPTRPCPTTCESCGGLPGKQRLALDHCHQTGKFRGWLCHLCNRAIGALGDSREGLLKALAYLERAQ